MESPFILLVNNVDKASFFDVVKFWKAGSHHKGHLMMCCTFSKMFQSLILNKVSFSHSLEFTAHFGRGRNQWFFTANWAASWQCTAAPVHHVIFMSTSTTFSPSLVVCLSSYTWTRIACFFCFTQKQKKSTVQFLSTFPLTILLLFLPANFQCIYVQALEATTV